MLRGYRPCHPFPLIRPLNHRLLPDSRLCRVIRHYLQFQTPPLRRLLQAAVLGFRQGYRLYRRETLRLTFHRACRLCQAVHLA